MSGETDSYHALQIPHQGFLHDLMREGKLHPDGYLDIIEQRLERVPESITSEDLHELWTSDRLTDEEYVSFDKSWPDSISELDDMRDDHSTKEFYERFWEEGPEE